MTTRPLIGLTGRQKFGHQLAGNPAILGDFVLDVFYTNYSNAVFEAGGLPVLLPLDIDASLYLDRLDGLLLSGGGDIDPVAYGHTAEPETEGIDAKRDRFELDLAKGALERGLPTVGICRGIQLLNVASGGTLRQHVPEHVGSSQPAAEPWHEVTISGGSRLGELYGPSRAVNSLHHQALDTIGDGLRVTARSDGDDSPEAVEHQTLPVIGVQWHPEMMATRSSDPLFGWLIDQARRHNATREVSPVG